jgi:ribokinase
MTSHSIAVVGSVNLDLVATVDELPTPGETVTGAALERFPGGKGANQALAARRLGADVSLIAAVGDDEESTLALRLLKDGDVDLAACQVIPSAPTGVALIAVSGSGENHIVVAPGANRMLAADQLPDLACDALICQLETPVETLEHAIARFDGFVCINLAPAARVPGSLIAAADLIVVNETEAAFYGADLGERTGLLAETFGSRGARLSSSNKVLAESVPPRVDAVDTTGAGDTFTAALTVALIEGMAPQRALDFACTAGALAATRAGAQPSLPYRDAVDAMLTGRSLPGAE